VFPVTPKNFMAQLNLTVKMFFLGKVLFLLSDLLNCVDMRGVLYPQHGILMV
jgi:hypothetical protein